MKKLLCMMIVIVLTFSMTLSAYAEPLSLNSSSLEMQIQDEIKRMEEIVYADLYDQLAEQDALDGIEYFKAFLKAEIEQAVYSKYSAYGDVVLPASTNDTYSYYFTNGGVVEYEGSLNAEYVVVCMNPDATMEYYYSDEYTVGDLILEVIGWIPGTDLISLSATFNGILTDAAKVEIRENDYYAKMVTITWGSGLEYGCYSYGWSTHPICRITDAVNQPEAWFG